MAIEFKKVEQDGEIGTVAKLAREIWVDHYTAIIGSDQVEYMLGKFQSPPAIREQLAQGYEYYVLQDRGEPTGYFSFFLRASGELFLSKIYVLKRQRGRGNGRACFEFILGRAKKLGARSIVLTVNKDNVDSCAIYEKLGFLRTRSVVADIGGGFVMDDWEYRLDI